MNLYIKGQQTGGEQCYLKEYVRTGHDRSRDRRVEQAFDGWVGQRNNWNGKGRLKLPKIA